MASQSGSVNGNPRCGESLINYKDSIHDDWFHLQGYPVSVKLPDYTMIQKEAADHILKLLEDTERQSARCITEKDGGYLQRLGRKLRDIQEKFSSSPVISELGVKYYKMPRRASTQLMIMDLNEYANLVHKMGYTLLQDAGSTGGCSILEGDGGDPMRLSNSAVVAYCSAVVPLWEDSSRDAHIILGGHTVEHDMNVHKGVFRFTPQENRYNIELKYTDTIGDSNWQERIDSIYRVMEEEYGLECDRHGANLTCKGTIKDLDKIREMAYFFSSLTYVATLAEYCIPDVIDTIIADAVAMINDYGDQTFTQRPDCAEEGKGNIYDCWAKRADCGSSSDDYNSYRRSSTHESLSASDNAREAVEVALRDVDGMPCGTDLYKKISYLNDVKKGPVGSYWTREADAAIKTALRECDVLSVVDSLVQEYNKAEDPNQLLTAYYLGEINDICVANENVECEMRTKQELLRLRQGAKQQLLPIAPE